MSKKKKKNINKQRKKKNIENIDTVVPWKKILKYYLITRICLLCFMCVAEFIISNSNLSDYDDVLRLFDNVHYLNIAKYGYSEKMQYAFFPLTPLLIRYLGKVGFIIFNQIIVFGSGYLLYLISKDILKKENAFFASVIYFISPIAVFTCMFYSEALFLFLTILSFYLFKTRKSYLLLGITLGLAVSTRSLASMLFFTIFIFMFIDFVKGREKFKNILITYIPATIISCLYPIFLYFETGNALYFIDVQFEYWGKMQTNIFTIFIDSAVMLFKDFHIICFLDLILVFCLFIFIFSYIIKHRKDKDYYELFVYLILTLLAISNVIWKGHTSVASLYRYIFGCFPLYFLYKNKSFNVILMIGISGFVSFMFLLGFYFY